MMSQRFIMNKIWKLKEKKEISDDIKKAAGSAVLAELLLQRGIDTVSKIENFLNPQKR